MEPSDNCYNFIKDREGFNLTAYTDSAGIWTIGYGTIIYKDHTHVQEGDTVTKEDAEDLLEWEVNLKSNAVNEAIGDTILTQNQFDALVSFAYNAGINALLTSTLLKRIKANPADTAIRNAFQMWDKAHVDGQLVVVQGLLNRRNAEADLYFS